MFTAKDALVKKHVCLSIRNCKRGPYLVQVPSSVEWVSESRMDDVGQDITQGVFKLE